VNASRGAVVDALISQDAYLRFLGIRSADPSTADGPTVVLPAEERHMGDHTRRTLHGGVVAAFLEAAAVLFLRSAGERVAVDVVEFTSDFLRPAPLADTTARVAPVHLGRRFAVVRVEAWQDGMSGPVAVGQGRFLIGAQGPPGPGPLA
jgi:uncharacterized protein (TIGR00369 family)